MRKIGLVASGSSETSASVILNEGEHEKVKTEDLVLIKNNSGNQILAVCRTGIGRNENLKTGFYSPGVAYAKAGRIPSAAKEFFEFKLSVIGDVSGGLLQNKTVIAPSSQVEIFDSEDDPMRYLGESKFSLGFYKEHPNWKIPINDRFIPYHLGVFGVTGSGKSFLARYELVPFLNKAGYDVIIFDWKGSDYAPFYPESVVRLKDVYLDEDVVTDYLASQMAYFGITGERKYNNDIIASLEEFISENAWRELKPEQLKEDMEKRVVSTISADNMDRGGQVNQWGRLYIRKFKRGLRKLMDDDVRNILGTKQPADILSLAREQHVLALDISEGSREEKLSIFLTLSKYLRSLMERKESLNLALLLDEGPQYCPFEPYGIQRETAEVITELCALGRSYNLAMVLLSQGIAGEIGINAAVRRNLNTQFIGKIHPLDMMEASTLLQQLEIDPRFLVSLPEGHFYFLGKMNPSPVPLLMSFQI